MDDLDPIPAHIPPWLRELYEAEQFIYLKHDPATGPMFQMSHSDREAEVSDGARDVFWVWSDLPRSNLIHFIDNYSARTGDITDLDEGRHIEAMSGGTSGYPHVIIPTNDPEVFAEAQPFERRELVTRLSDFSSSYIDRVPPLDPFELPVLPDM